VRALLYARQSTEKEEGERSLSLDSQVTALTDRCQREGWTVVGVVRESGLKGYQDVDERPGMAEAMRRAEAGDYTMLLVWDLSRLARSLRLQEQWVWQFDRLGVTVVSHSEPHATDTLLRQIPEQSASIAPARSPATSAVPCARTPAAASPTAVRPTATRVARAKS
jgi:DNA invertase Pin-like site-specific DNA recombinase